MRPLGVAGILLQVYGPSVVAFALYLRHHPPLCLLAIIGGFYYVVASILPACVWQITTAPGVILPLSAILEDAACVALFVGLHRVMAAFAAKRMPLYKSRLGIIPAAFALGLGFGVVHAALQLGSFLSFETSVPLSAWRDPARCASLPFTSYQALVAFCFLHLHVGWMVINFGAYARLVAEGVRIRDVGQLRSHRSALGRVAWAWGAHISATFLTLPDCHISLPCLFALLVANCAVVYHSCARQIAWVDGDD
jgi:hypothetical protein